MSASAQSHLRFSDLCLPPTSHVDFSRVAHLSCERDWPSGTCLIGALSPFSPVGRSRVYHALASVCPGLGWSLVEIIQSGVSSASRRPSWDRRSHGSEPLRGEGGPATPPGDTLLQPLMAWAGLHQGSRRVSLGSVLSCHQPQYFSFFWGPFFFLQRKLVLKKYSMLVTVYMITRIIMLH